MRRTNLYLTLAVAIVLIGSVVSYYLINKTSEENRIKGYSLTSFNPPCDVDPLYVQKLRSYKSFTLTSDTTTNDKTISEMELYLNDLKRSGDSLNGVHLIMANDMPYKYYLKAVEIFNQLPPRKFFTLENNFYAISNSKFQIKQNSIRRAQAEKEGVGFAEY
jgi:hypothetical protein